MNMSESAAILFSACLLNNLILTHGLGVLPGLSPAGRWETAIGLARVMLFLLPLCTLSANLLMNHVLAPLGLEYLQLICLVLALPVIVLALLALLRRWAPGIVRRYAVFVPIALFNTAVIGAALLDERAGHGAFAALLFGLGAGAGYSLVILMLAELQQRLVPAAIPASFRGLPIQLVTLGLIAMAFTGLSGPNSP